MLMLSDKQLLETERVTCENSLANFTKRSWKSFEPSTYVHNWHIDCVSDHLTAVADGHITRLIINLPPRCMKSSTALVTFPAWLWAQDPDPNKEGHGRHVRPGTWRGAGTRFLTASYAANLATRDAVKSRRLIDSNWYQRLWPDRVTFASDQNTKTRYENMQGGARFTTSVDGQVTGEGGDIILIDDPHNVKQTDSDQVRGETLRWFFEAMPSRLNNFNSGVFILIMQRIHARDLTGAILARESGWEHVCLPMRFEEDHPTPMRSSLPKWQYDKRYTDGGELLWPDRINEKAVKTLELALGAYGAAGQLQQRPAPREGGLFKRSWFRKVQTVPAGARKIRGWDFAGTEEGVSDSSAYTVGLLLSEYKGVYYIEHVNRFRGSPAEVESEFQATTRADGTNVEVSIPQDPGQAGKAQARAFVKNMPGFRIRATPESGDKVTRAGPVASQAEAGNVMLVEGGWNDAFLEEAGMFPTGQFKDQIDALSRAFSAHLLEAPAPTAEAGAYGYGNRR